MANNDGYYYDEDRESESVVTLIFLVCLVYFLEGLLILRDFFVKIWQDSRYAVGGALKFAREFGRHLFTTRKSA